MPIDMRGIETVLEAASRGFSQGLANRQFGEQQRAKKVQEDTELAKEEQRKKEHADALKLQTQQINSQIEYNKAQLALAKRAADLTALQAGQSIQEKSDKMGSAPGNAVPMFDAASGISMPGAPVVTPETGTIIQTDFQDRAKRRGEIQLAEDQPQMNAQNALAMKLLEERARQAAADDARQATREAEKQKTEFAYREKKDNEDRALKREEIAAHWGQTNAMREIALADKRNQQLAKAQKLEQTDQDRLSANAIARADIKEIRSLLDATIKGGQWNGRKVKDVWLSEGAANTIDNAIGRGINWLTNTQVPEIARLNTLMQQFASPERQKIFGAALTQTERPYADEAFGALNSWSSNRTKGLQTIDTLWKRVINSNKEFVNSLTKEQREALHPSLKTRVVKSGWQTMPDGSRKKVEEEE